MLLLRTLGGLASMAVGLHATAAAAQADPVIAEPSQLLAAPEDGLAYWNRSVEALNLFNEGRLGEAEQAYLDITRAYPVRGAPWVGLGNTRGRLGKHREAADAYRIAADLIGPLGPGQPRYFQAVNLVAAGDFDAALAVVEDYVFEARAPRRPSLYDDPAFAPLRPYPRFVRAAGRHDGAAQLSRVAGWRLDIEHLLAEMQRIEPEFRKRPLRPSIVTQARDLAASVPTATDEQIYVGIERIIAGLGHGHAGLLPSVSSRLPFTQLPVQFWAFPEGIFIVNASGGAEGLYGAQLIAIEETPAMDALRELGAIQANESGMQVLWTGVYHLGIAQRLNGLGISRRSDEIALKLRLPNGQVVDRVLRTVPLQRRPKLAAPRNVEPPLFLRSVREAHRFEVLAEDDAVYVQLNQVAPDPDESLPAFGLRLRGALDTSNVKNLILDLRHNNGGDTSTYPELVRSIIRFTSTPGTQLYVIIGRGTYSAAANLIADLERFANPLFVGEPSSMAGNNAGDESMFVLPYSGIAGAFSSVNWQLSNPWDTRRSIVPQIPVPLTAAAYFAGRDPVLEAILSRIRAN